MDHLMTKLDRMDQEERKKIFKMLKEEKEDEAKMDWMYKANQPDTEEYLLGRRIDKHIEEQDKPEENNDAPGALFQEVLVRRAELDMQAKMREDPLYAIRQKEEEARKRLLQNPIKLKQLQKLMKECEKKKEKKEKKKRKKSKKKHKQSSDSDDSDDEILNQYLSLLKQSKPDDSRLKERRNASDSDERNMEWNGPEEKRHPRKSVVEGKYDRSRRHESGENPKSRREIEDHQSRTHRYHSSDDDDDDDDADCHHHTRKQHKSYGLLVKGENKIKMERSRSEERQIEKSQSKKHARSKSRSRSPIRNRLKHNTRRDEGKHEPKRRHSRSPARKESRKKLTAEEMERRRVEMMENARWRDEQRERNVKKYREEEAKEKEALEKRGSSSDFLNPMLMKHASSTSVEDRIKRNIYNVQRTKVDLEKKFTKR